MSSDCRYVLSRLVLGSRADVELSESEFRHLAEVRSVIARAVVIEDKFDILMEDHAALELQFLTLSNREMIFGRHSWAEFPEALNAVNRHMLHLLTASRMYVDQVQHDLSRVFGSDSTELAAFTAACSREYDAVLGYRVMEALRNYSQHRSLPVHNLRFGWTRDTETDLHAYSIEYSLDIVRLRADKKFKRSVLEELEAMATKDDKVRLKPLVRSYVSALGRIHREARALLADRLAACDAESAEAVERFVRETGEDVSHVYAAEIRQRDGRDAGVLERHAFFSEVSEHRRRLVSKNTARRQLETRYVSGAPTADGT